MCCSASVLLEAARWAAAIGAVLGLAGSELARRRVASGGVPPVPLRSRFPGPAGTGVIGVAPAFRSRERSRWLSAGVCGVGDGVRGPTAEGCGLPLDLDRALAAVVSAIVRPPRVVAVVSASDPPFSAGVGETDRVISFPRSMPSSLALRRRMFRETERPFCIGMRFAGTGSGTARRPFRPGTAGICLGAGVIGVGIGVIGVGPGVTGVGIGVIGVGCTARGLASPGGSGGGAGDRIVCVPTVVRGASPGGGGGPGGGWGPQFGGGIAHFGFGLGRSVSASRRIPAAGGGGGGRS